MPKELKSKKELGPRAGGRLAWYSLTFCYVGFALPGIAYLASWCVWYGLAYCLARDLP
jgi:hypothetical protein